MSLSIVGGKRVNECDICPFEEVAPHWVIQCAHFDGQMVRVWRFEDDIEQDGLNVEGPFTEEALDTVLNSTLTDAEESVLLGDNTYFGFNAEVDAAKEFERRCELMRAIS